MEKTYRYYEVAINHPVEFGRYFVRATSIPEAHDKALAAATKEAQIAGVEAHFMPSVKAVEEFCSDEAVIT